jgi:hypothetical protein
LIPLKTFALQGAALVGVQGAKPPGLTLL